MRKHTGLYSFIFASLFILFLTGCKKNSPEDETDPCPPISLTVKHSFNRNDLGYSVLKIIQNEAGYYYASASVPSSLDYRLLKMDANFNVVDDYLFESQKIVDFLPLADGRIIISGPNEVGKLGVLSADFTTIERFDYDYQTWPYLFDVGDGFIAADGSGVYSLRLYKYTYDFDQVWVKNFGPSMPQTYFLNADKTQLYITTQANDIHILDTYSGNKLNSLVYKPGLQLWKLYAENDEIYITGVEGPPSECKKNIFVARIDEYGNAMWHRQYRSDDSDDWSNHIIKYNHKLYISAGYARSCTPTAFGGYMNYYLLELDAETGEPLRCLLDKTFKFGFGNHCFVDKDGELISVGSFTNTETATDERRLMRVD